MEQKLNEICQYVIDGEDELIEAAVEKAIEADIDPNKILNEGLIAGMNEVGEQFARQEIFLPNIIMSAETMNAGVRLIEPLLNAGEAKAKGKVIIGTVSGDLHDIGKNLVAVMMKTVGYEIIDLGADVDIQEFVDAVKKEGAGILAMSALLTTTMEAQREVIDALKEAGIRDDVKIMIGGAPVSQDFADRIGADGYSVDALSAAKLSVELMK